MKSFFLSLFLLFSASSFCQDNKATITKYSDERLPSELVATLKNISVDDFDKFREKGIDSTEYKGVATKFKYKVKYLNGFFVGKLELSGVGSFDVELPSRYCCSNHNPSHCSSKSEEIIKNQKEHGCLGWKRAEVEQ